MNTAHWVPDLFMKRLGDISEGRLSKDATWTLFHTNETPDLPDLYGQKFEQRYLEYERLSEEGKIYGRKIRVLALWKKMIEALFETGHPWITFKDPCNLRSPQDHAGVIHNSNLCTEITLNTSTEEVAVCNLASINIPNHLREDGAIDHKKLQTTIRTVMRMLDNCHRHQLLPGPGCATCQYSPSSRGPRGHGPAGRTLHETDTLRFARSLVHVPRSLGARSQDDLLSSHH
jgi:ribonucleoside-diphosphate reductase alpha chain